jgi:hypothetical protein
MAVDEEAQLAPALEVGVNTVSLPFSSEERHDNEYLQLLRRMSPDSLIVQDRVFCYLPTIRLRRVIFAA